MKVLVVGGGGREHAIIKKIKENNELYEKVDRSIRFGNVEGELSKLFEDNIRNIKNTNKEKPIKNSIFYLKKNATDKYKIMNNISPRNLSLDNSSLSNYNNMLTYTNTNASNQYIKNNKVNSLKSLILNNQQTPNVKVLHNISKKRKFYHTNKALLYFYYQINPGFV